MKKKIFLFISSFTGFMFLLLPVFSSSSLVMAQAGTANQDTNLLCQVFPFIQAIGFADALCGGDVQEEGQDLVNTGAELVRFGLSLIFIGIIGIAIFYIIKSAIKYIRSEGDESKIEESTKAIKAVFIGVGALIVGIIGLVLVLALLNVSGSALETTETPDVLTP